MKRFHRQLKRKILKLTDGESWQTEILRVSWTQLTVTAIYIAMHYKHSFWKKLLWEKEKVNRNWNKWTLFDSWHKTSFSVSNSPLWHMVITIRTNKNLLQFVTMSMDGSLRANISHSHNGLYASFCHNRLHSTKAVTDFSFLSVVWQHFAKVTRRRKFAWWVSHCCWKKGVQ